MIKYEEQCCRQKILKCLSDEFRNNTPIFDSKTGKPLNDVTLKDVMNAVTRGLQFAYIDNQTD